MNIIITMMLLFSTSMVFSQNGDSIFIKIPDYNEKNKIYYNKSMDARHFRILFSHTLTFQSSQEKASFLLQIPIEGEARDSSLFSKKKIYTPEMIMDNLTKYRHDYERRNRSNFYIIIKGQGPIWYLHKASLTYIYSNPYSFHKNRNIDEMATSMKEFVTKNYPANANSADILNSTDPLEPYRAMMFMGLQNSQFYGEKVDDNRNRQFQGFIQSLSVFTSQCPSN